MAKLSFLVFICISGCIVVSLDDVIGLGSSVTKFLSSENVGNVKASSKSLNENTIMKDKINGDKCDQLFIELQTKLTKVYHEIKKAFEATQFETVHEFESEYLNMFQLAYYFKSNMVETNAFMPDIALYLLDFTPYIIPISLVSHHAPKFDWIDQYGKTFKQLYNEYSCHNIRYLYKPLSTQQFNEQIQYYQNEFNKIQQKILGILERNASFQSLSEPVIAQTIHNFKSVYGTSAILMQLFKSKSKITYQYAIVSKRIRFFKFLREIFPHIIVMEIFSLTLTLQIKLMVVADALHAILFLEEFEYFSIEMNERTHRLYLIKKIKTNLNEMEVILNQLVNRCSSWMTIFRCFGSIENDHQYWIKMYVREYVKPCINDIQDKFRRINMIGIINIAEQAKKLMRYCNTFQGCTIVDENCQRITEHCQEIFIFLHYLVPFELLP